MSKKIVVASLAGIALLIGGCATHQQSNQLAGAAIGGIIGHEVGGRQGAAVGAALGTIIGGQQPASPPVVISRPPAVYYNPPVYAYQQREVCYLNQRVYQQRIANCNERARYDSYYRFNYLGACYDQARQSSTSCR